MNIQIFGSKKCFDTKKAERYFKERKIKYQYIDIFRFGLSKGELKSVLASVGISNLVNKKMLNTSGMSVNTTDTGLLEDKLFSNPKLFKTPIIRNGKKATVGYCPDVWSAWD